MSLFFYIRQLHNRLHDHLEQAKLRTAYKLKKYRERLANLLDHAKEHRREDQPQRERIGEESEGDAVIVYYAAGGRPVPDQPVGRSQQHLQGI